MHASACERHPCTECEASCTHTCMPRAQGAVDSTGTQNAAFPLSTPLYTTTPLCVRAAAPPAVLRAPRDWQDLHRPGNSKAVVWVRQLKPFTREDAPTCAGWQAYLPCFGPARHGWLCSSHARVAYRLLCVSLLTPRTRSSESSSWACCALGTFCPDRTRSCW